MEKLTEIIEAQQKGKENTDVYCVGEQLKDIGAESEHNREILIQDLQIAEMDLVHAAAKIKEYADKNRKGARCFCVTPKVAAGILREFYGLASAEPEREKTPAADESYIDLSAFL